MSDRAQVVIIGAGAMGASVAYHLARRGVTDVLVLERGPHPVYGSTGRSAAGVRHQFSSRTNVLLSLYSIERLKHFEEEVGGHSELRQVGYLLLVNDAHAWEQSQRNVAMQRGLGAPVELLTPDEAARIVPGLRTDDLFGATWGPQDGYCDPHGVAMGYLTRARELGVRLRCDSRVTGIDVQGERVAGVRVGAESIACELVVNAAGPWAGQVAALAGLDVPVRPYRRNVYAIAPFAGMPAPLPMTIDVGSGFWIRGEGAGAIMGLARPDEPSSENLSVDWEWLDAVLDAGFHRWPLLESARLIERQCWAGLYEITPDSNPILGRHPDLPNYVDVSGFSGHGIMHSPAAGLLIAEEIIDGRAHTIPIDDLRVTRFAGVAVGERNVF